MTTKILEFRVTEQILTLTTSAKDIVNNSRNYLECCFVFDDSWVDVGTKTAVFDLGGETEQIKVLLDAQNYCNIPNNVLVSDQVDISVFGGDRKTTNAVRIKFIDSGYLPTDEPVGKEINWYDQVMARLDKVDGSGLDISSLATKNEVSDSIGAIKIPVNVSELTNDAVYQTKADVDTAIGAINLTPYAQKVDIPTVVSQLTNDKEYQTKSEVDEAIANITIDTSTLAKATELAEEKSAREKADTTLQENIDKIVIPTKVSELSNDSNYQTNTDVSNAIANKADTSSIPTKTSQLTNDSNFSTKQDLNVEVSNAISALDFSTYASKEYVDEQILASSTGEIDLSQYATKAEVTSATNYLNATSKPQINSVELVGNKSLADLGIVIPTKVSNLTNDNDYQSKTQVDASIAAAVATRTETYSKTEIDTKLNTINEVADKKVTKEELNTLKTSVMDTSAEFQTQMATLKGELTTASDNMTKSLTNMQTSLTTTADSINARYDELVANVTSNLSTLNATDATLRSDIDTINTKIPNSATSTNMLADKAWVQELVKNNAARAISSDATGNGFASLEALNAGPWYSLGVEATPQVNDYAVVKKDTTHSGNDVRYNYDGSVWVFFQEFTSGSSWTPTTDESLALASGITAEKVALIDTNKASIDKEITDRSQADSVLQGTIATETSNRETAINNLTALISGEKLARENGDNQVQSLVTDEENARISAINTLTATVSANKQDIEGKVGELTSLHTTVKTSVVGAINELDTGKITEEQARAVMDGAYATQFANLTTTLTTRMNNLEATVARFDGLTATTKYLNHAGQWWTYKSGETKTCVITDTNLKANEIALRHDTSNTNNTMTDFDYGNGIVSNVQKVWFTDNTDTTGLTFHYLYAGGSGRCVWELSYVATGEIIGWFVIGTSYWQAITVDDIAWSKTIYS